MLDRLHLELDGQGPLYRQIYRAMRQAVVAGVLPPGSKLPSSRTLANHLQMSRTTVLLALDQLRAEGYVEGRLRAGTFVRSELPDDMFRARRHGTGESATAGRSTAKLSRRGRSFRDIPGDRREADIPVGDGGMVFQFGELDPADFPSRVWSRLARGDRGKPGSGYGNPAGHPELREVLSSYLQRTRGVQCDLESLIITAGAQQAIELTASVVIDTGDTAIVEEPHYHRARQAFRSYGANIKALKADAAGMQTGMLNRVGNASVVHLTPSHQFPLGGIMSVTRRFELLRWARRARAVVIEDDYDGEYQYGVRPIAALQSMDQHGSVVYIGSFSKTLSPALRIGYAVAPPGLREAMLGAKLVSDWFTPPQVQRTLARFVAEGHFDAHLRRMRRRHHERRSAMLESLDASMTVPYTVTGSDAGLSVALQLPDMPADKAGHVVRLAAHQGVGIESMRPFYLRAPPHASFLLGYGALSPSQIRTGIAVLGKVLSKRTR